MAWTPTTEELDQIMAKALADLARRHPRVEWLELPYSPDSLDPPDVAGYVCVGAIVAVGEPNDRDMSIWWHPGKREGRLRKRTE